LHKDILFINNADYKVWVAKGACYSDTITSLPGSTDVSPHSSKNMVEPSGYEKLIEIVPNKEIILIVEKDDPFGFDRRYILSIDSLNKLGRTVTYP
jgi:hypothetical protein